MLIPTLLRSANAAAADILGGSLMISLCTAPRLHRRARARHAGNTVQAAAQKPAPDDDAGMHGCAARSAAPMLSMRFAASSTFPLTSITSTVSASATAACFTPAPPAFLLLLILPLIAGAAESPGDSTAGSWQSGRERDTAVGACEADTCFAFRRGNASCNSFSLSTRSCKPRASLHGHA
jgi:hypothetical protein